MRQTGQTEDAGPLAQLRESWGMSRTAFAAAMGCGYMVAYNVERGLVTRIPARMVAALADAGVDVEELDREHRRWIESRAARLRAEIAGARA